MRGNKGFTLMEMLIVVAILAILLAISIGALSTSLEKAKETKDLSNIRNACSEMQMISLMDDGYDKTKYEKYKASDGTNYLKTYVNCASTKKGWQMEKNATGKLLCGATLYAPTSAKPSVRIRLNLDTGVIDFNPEAADNDNKRICVYNR